MWVCHPNRLDGSHKGNIDSEHTRRFWDIRLMALTTEHMHLASMIHNHVQTIKAQGGGDEGLLHSLYDYMGAFKRIMDTTTRDEMDALCVRYSGFFRFARLLEQLAEGIADGRIEVPK